MLRAACLFVATALTACSAPAATRSFPVGGFDRIRSSVPFDIHVRTGTAPAVRANGPQDAVDRLTVSVSGGELVIGTAHGRWWSWHGGHQRAVIDVTVPMLRAATLAGPGDMTIDRIRTRDFAGSISGPGDMTIAALEAERVMLNLSGPGDLKISGRAATGSLVLHGPGDIHAEGLSLQNADVQLSGPGDIAVHVSGTARGRLSGPGDISITGGARCSISKSGPGDVSCR